jgi:hypothetical protein
LTLFHPIACILDAPPRHQYRRGYDASVLVPGRRRPTCRLAAIVILKHLSILQCGTTRVLGCRENNGADPGRITGLALVCPGAGPCLSSVPLENSSQTRFFSRERQPRERGAPHPPHMRISGIVISKTHSILQYMAILPANETLATCSRGRRPPVRSGLTEAGYSLVLHRFSRHGVATPRFACPRKDSTTGI